MKTFVIFADASSDINPSFLRKEDIRVLPMLCLSKGEPRTLTGFESDEELASFYREMRAGKMFSTSQITPREYEEAFTPVMKEGSDVLYLALSGGLTGTVESARMAAEKLNAKLAPARVFVVDTLSATGGVNLLLEKAAEIRREGADAAEAAEKLSELAKRVCHVFLVSDLMHLSRGGRLSGASAVVGTMLHVLPILVIDAEGKLQVVDKKRGMKSAIREIRQRFEASWDGREQRMYTTHGDSPGDADLLDSEIREADPEADIEQRVISPVIGTHTGPGLLSIVYFGDRAKIM